MKVNRALDVRAHMFWEVSDQNGAAYLGCSRSINAEFRNAVCDAMGEWSDVSTALHRAYVERFVPEVPSESSLD